MTPTTMHREVDSATFMSYNCTGIENPVKCRWLNDICDEYNVDFLNIQEHFKSSKTTDKFFRSRFPSYNSVIVPGQRSPGQDTGRAKAGLAQCSRRSLAVKRKRVSTKHYRVQAQVLHLPTISVLWINTYLPTDPQNIRQFDDTELQSCLSEVENIVTNTSHTDIVWGSDLNWDMTRNSRFSQIVSGFMEKLNLVSLWNHHRIDHTYQQLCKNDRVSQSTIDHFVISPRLLPLIVDCGVVHRGDNMSFHSPIWVRLRVGALPLKKNVTTNCEKKPSWSTASQEQIDSYTATLQARLEAVQVPHSLLCTDVHCQVKEHSEERDSMVLDILCALVESSYTTLPLYGGKGAGRSTTGGRGTAYPGWSEQVKPYQIESRYWHDAWVKEGRPRGNWLHRLMVKKRSQYHYAIRRVRGKADLTRAEQLFEASLLGDCNLLKEMKKIRCGGTAHSQELPDSVSGATGEDEIADKFKTVYEALYNSADTNVEMNELLEKVNSLIGDTSQQEVAKITGNIVKETVTLLKAQKGDVSGSFTSDAILHAPDNLFELLAATFRSFLVHGTVTSYLLACSFLPLLKGTKDPSDTGSYRAIAGSSLILKLFEKVILQIWGHLLTSDSLQFGFKARTSTTQCSWLVSEVVQLYLRQGSHPIVTLLDCKAAFDTCKFATLFKRVLEKGVPPVVVRALMFSYQQQYAWVRWGKARSDLFKIRNGTRQGSIASPVLWSIYCDLLLKELRQLGLGAHVAGLYMGVAAYADDLVLIAPSRHAMQLMLDVCEDYAARYNIKFSTDADPSKSKTKCIFMIGNSRNIAKPVPLQLCGRDLPWVESATHLGHELHCSGTMDHDCNVARARLIDQTVEVRKSFSFASPVEVLRAMQVYCTSYYGSMLWNLQSEAAQRLYNAWTTAIKLAWDCPRATRTYLVQQVLACDSSSAKTEILARFCKFFRSLRVSQSFEVASLANLISRDVRSSTGANLRAIRDLSGKDPWVDSPTAIKAALVDAEIVKIQDMDKWRVRYLGVLLEQRMEWNYLGSEDEKKAVQKLIDSLCIN